MKRLAIALAALLVASAGLSACSSSKSTDSSPGTTAKADPSLAGLLPADVKKSGVVLGASSFTTPPLYTFESDGKTPSGVLVQLIENAAAHMGVKVRWSQLPYAGQVPALESGKIQITGSQYSATTENKASTNIVSVYKNTLALVVPAKKKADYTSLSDACGKSFAAPLGSTIEAHALDVVNKSCDSSHKSKLVRFPSAPAALTAIKSGRVDGYFYSLASANYAVKQSPSDFATVFTDEFEKYNSGFAVAKDATQLADAFAAAFNATIKDGTYAEIMKKWDMASSLYSTSSSVNPSEVAQS